MLHRFEIDDPLDTTQVHGLCGFWAIIAKGIFDRDQGIFATGLANFIGIQFIGAITITLWAATLSFIFFYTLKRQNRLRIGLIYEIIGIDFIEHGSQGNKINLELLRNEHKKDLMRQEQAENQTKD